MKNILISLLVGVLCFGMMGCEDDDDSSSSTVAVAETNAPVANEGSSSSNESTGGFGAPVAATTVTGRWIGFCVDGAEKLGLSLKLAQAGETVTGTYAFWPDHNGSPILSGTLSGNTFSLVVKRNDIPFTLDGQVDFAAATISGTWEDQAGSSGTFSLNKWE